MFGDVRFGCLRSEDLSLVKTLMNADPGFHFAMERRLN